MLEFFLQICFINNRLINELNYKWLYYSFHEAEICLRGDEKNLRLQKKNFKKI